MQVRIRRRKELLDRARGLPDAVLVFDQRKADKAFPILAEAHAWRNGHAGFLQQKLGKRQGANLLHAFGQRRPGEHRAGRRRDVPACAVQGFDQAIAPALISLAHLIDALLRAVEGGSRRDLDRRESAVVEIGFDARERRDEPLVADGKAHAPAGHRIGLRQRGELHRDVHRARHLQDRGRRLVAEINLGIGDIRKQDEIVLARVVHHVLVEIEARHDRGRV